MIRKLLACLFVLVLTGSSGLKSISAANTPKNKTTEVADTLRTSTDNATSAKEKCDLDPVAVIRQALTKKVSWNFKEMPLSEVVEALHKELNVPVYLDNKAMIDIGVTPETKVFFKLSGVTAKKALHLMLQDMGLAYYINEEVLTITSPDTADNMLFTEFYNVADLPSFRRGNGGTVPNYDKLIDLITFCVKPTTWDEVGGSGSIIEYDAAGIQILVISQTSDVHEEIQQLLDRLRTFRQWPLDKETVEKLPPEPTSAPKQRGPRGVGMMMGGMGGGVPGTGAPGTAAPPATTPPAVNPPAKNPPANPAPSGSVPATPPGPGQGMGMF
jgi:hypothetical protein